MSRQESDMEENALRWEPRWIDGERPWWERFYMGTKLPFARRLKYKLQDSEGKAIVQIRLYFHFASLLDQNLGDVKNKKK